MTMDTPMEEGPSTYVPVSDPWSYLSLEDKASLDGLPLAEIQRCTRNMLERHRDYMLALSTIHNAATPIHALLPPEVLIHIFAMIPVEDLRDVRLTLVCRKWRDLLLRTPEFWANLLTIVHDQAIKDDFLATALQRAYPLQIALRVSMKLLQRPQFEPHLNRISSLRVDMIVSWYEGFHALIKHRRLPVLVSLTIDLFVGDGRKLSDLCHRLRPCTDDDLPCLRHLSIPGELFAFLFSVTQLESLLICRLEYLHEFFAFGYAANLVKALRQCTTLRTLRVESLPGNGWDDIERPQAESSPFPNLFMLEILLSHDHAPLVNVLTHLVQHIVLPHGARIRLISGRADSPVSIMLPAHPLPTKPEGKALVYVDVSGPGPLALTIFLDDNELLEIKVTPPQQTATTLAPEPITAPLVRYIRFFMQQYLTFIQDINILEVHYGLNHSITRDGLKVLLELLPSLRSLILHGWLPPQFDTIDPNDPSGIHHDLLGVLCTGSHPDGDIPCPSLRELEFICEGPMPAAKLLAARFAAVLSTRQAKSAPRLDKFTLRNYPRNVAAQHPERTISTRK
ncbi:hypothetical protein C8T65DRAFT_294727 [Cerioporus squamosus]|nr:hypothetical protein C8T65DRAFT_294727 [Cerioporus squamosus]